MTAGSSATLSGGASAFRDSRGAALRNTFDAAQRPLDLFITDPGGEERLAESLEYGEGLANSETRNLRGRVAVAKTECGTTTTDAYDFAGNITSATRRFLEHADRDVDWSKAQTFGPDAFDTATEYDALSRVTAVTTPDGTRMESILNERSLVSSMRTVAGGADTSHIAAAEYDEHARRTSISYGNGARKQSTYDPSSFRLKRLLTTRPQAGGPVQDLAYTYDAAGNITRIADAAQQTTFFANQLVAPRADYAYDAIYRLTSANGREHATSADPVGWDDSPHRSTVLPSDTQAMRNYTETFGRDAVGNLTSVKHIATKGTWTRAYTYGTNVNNRLTRTTVGATNEDYTYDANGNMITMPHLPALTWDAKDRLRSTTAQVVADGAAPATWYRYDSSGARARKATVDGTGRVTNERFYVGAYEIYREYSATGKVTLERQSLAVADGNQPLALIDTTTVGVAGRATRYQFANHLGSSCLELDENAAVITYEEYYPFGATSFIAGRSAAEVGLKRYRYTGKERDEESGLDSRACATTRAGSAGGRPATRRARSTARTPTSTCVAIRSCSSTQAARRSRTRP